MTADTHRAQIDQQLNRAWQQHSEAELDGDRELAARTMQRIDELLDTYPRQQP